MRYKVMFEARRSTAEHEVAGDVPAVVSKIIRLSMHVPSLKRITIIREDGGIAESEDGEFINSNFPLGNMRRAFGCLWMFKERKLNLGGRRAGGEV